MESIESRAALVTRASYYETLANDMARRVENLRKELTIANGVVGVLSVATVVELVVILMLL